MTKTAAVINDLSGFGKCSLTAAIAVLSVMGVQPCPLPTAILTNQTGFKDYYCYDFSDKMCYYKEMWKRNNAEFDGIYSGYVAHKSQVDFIGDFIKGFRKSYTKVIVDPVMADNGKMYSAYNKTTCQKVRELSKTADIITPNLTELCILANCDYEKVISKTESPDFFEYIEKIAKKVIAHNHQQVAVTGIKKDNYVYNGFFEKGKSSFSKSFQYGNNFSGTGDLFASIICGSVLNGVSTENAVKTATKFLEEVIADTVKEAYQANHGVDFEKHLYKLAIHTEWFYENISKYHKHKKSIES